MKSKFRDFITRLKQHARQIKQETNALYLAYYDVRTPWYVRGFVLLVVAYALSPIDLIPDFIPVIGYLDDIILLPLGIMIAIRLVPPQVMVECRERARTTLSVNRSVRWSGGLIVLFVWAIVGIVIFNRLF